MEDRELPPTFINVVERGQMIEMTTLELVKINSKVRSFITHNVNFLEVALMGVGPLP